MSRHVGPTPTKRPPAPDLSQGLCVGGRDPDLWAWRLDNEGIGSRARTERIAKAKAICHRCSVQHACREWRLTGPTRPAGVHGGQLWAEGVTEPEMGRQRQGAGV